MKETVGYMSRLRFIKTGFCRLAARPETEKRRKLRMNVL
jgi:hypothetical protein